MPRTEDWRMGNSRETKAAVGKTLNIKGVNRTPMFPVTKPVVDPGLADVQSDKNALGLRFSNRPRSDTK